MTGKFGKTAAKWQARLSPGQYHITREKGTERAFTGKCWNCDDDGTYHCVCCGEALFSSDTQLDAGSGWPSFRAPLIREATETEEDRKFNGVRTEVLCKNCGARRDHVFPDGPKPTGLRYCISAASLNLK